AQRVAEIVVERGVLGFAAGGRDDRDRALEQGERLAAAPGRLRDGAEQLQAVEIIGIARKHCAVAALGVCEIAGLMMGECLANEIIGRERAHRILAGSSAPERQRDLVTRVMGVARCPGYSGKFAWLTEG